MEAETHMDRRERYEIRMAGFGGQGLLFAGRVLGIALAVHARENVVQTQSYGPESRGGASRSEIIVGGEEEIDYIKLENPDMLVLMSQEACDKFFHNLKPGGYIILDPGTVKIHPDPPPGSRLMAISASRMAHDMGIPMSTNMIMLGAVVGLSGVVEVNHVIQAIRDISSGAVAKANEKAFYLGMEEVAGQKGGAR